MDFYFEVFKLLISLFTIIFAAFQVILLIKQIRDSVRWNKNDATFRFVRTLDNLRKDESGVLEEIHYFDYENIFLSTEQFKIFMKDPVKKRVLNVILAEYETFSVAILSKYVNEKISKRLYYSNFINAYNKFNPYIALRNEEVKGEMYQHFKMVVSKWGKEGINSYGSGEY